MLPSQFEEVVEEESPSEELNAEATEVVCRGDEAECDLLVIMRLLSIDQEADQDWRRKSLFHTRCKTNGKLCELVIDSGACENIVALTMVEKLGLKMEPLPHPYKLSWLDNKHEIRVQKRCLVPFSITKYEDEVWCHVIPMTACHMLLGRPWLYDRDVQHQGKANTYSLKKDNCNYTLLPLAPEKRRKKGEMNAVGFLSDEEKGMILKSYPTIIPKELEDQPAPKAPVPRLVRILIDKFPMVFPKELPRGLPPFRTTQHNIDFHTDAIIPNKPAYKMNPKEHDQNEPE
jgi:hypothetical protein